MSALKKPDCSKLQRLADQAQSKGRYEEALDHSEEILLHFPANSQAQLTAAQCCLVLDRHETALAYLNKFLKQQPNHAMALNNRGVAFEMLGEYDQALKDFARARQLEPQYEDACLNDYGVEEYPEAFVSLSSYATVSVAMPGAPGENVLVDAATLRHLVLRDVIVLPEGYEWVPFPFVVNVEAGTIVEAHQHWVP